MHPRRFADILVAPMTPQSLHDLIGGPDIGFSREVIELVREREATGEPPADSGADQVGQ